MSGAAIQSHRRPFVAHFFAILRLLLRRPSSTPNLIFLIFISSLDEVLIYHVGLLSAQFYYILISKDLSKFYLQLSITLALILFMALIKSSKSYVASVLYIEWRQYLSKVVINEYFRDLNYYVLNLGERGWTTDVDSSEWKPLSLDNVDQRITQDIDKLCVELSTVISQIVLSPFTLMYYSLRVYLTIGLFGLLTCFGIFVASTLVNRIFIKSIVKWTYLKGKHEGNYRTGHANIVKYSELITFANAQDAQKRTTFAQLKTLLSVHENLILSQFYLNVSTAIFDYSGAVLSFIIIAVPIFGGAFDHLNEAELSRMISSNAFICLYLISCFSRIIDISSNFAQINGFGYRITELLHAFARESKPQSPLFRATGDSLEQGQDKSALYLRLSNVHFEPPSFSQQLHPITVKGISFEVREGHNLYITGESGLGKTSIFRVIKGLWPISCGAIYCALNVHDVKQTMFVSHNSRFAHFFLQDILSDADSRQRFIALLNEYSLSFILDPKKPTVNEEALESLSPGQLQILNFLFVFFFVPKLCFLDDATNSLSDHVIERLYDQCRTLSITVVTIANNDYLHRFHSHFMRLN